MTHPAARLREVFEAHEHLAPDPATVRTGALALVARYRRRRRAVQVAGSAALSVGLAVGVATVPSWLQHRPGQGDTVHGPAGPGSAPTASPVPDPQQDRYDAFLAAGYDYDDAVALAAAWGGTGDVAATKAEAGRRLLLGEQLPIAPGSAPAAPAPALSDDERAREAFSAAGYDVEDAVALARLWGAPDPYQVKSDAGRKLLAGETLPIAP